MIILSFKSACASQGQHLLIMVELIQGSKNFPKEHWISYEKCTYAFLWQLRKQLYLSCIYMFLFFRHFDGDECRCIHTHFETRTQFLNFNFSQDPYAEYDFWLNKMGVDGVFTDFTGSLHKFQKWNSMNESNASKLLHKIALLVSSY